MFSAFFWVLDCLPFPKMGIVEEVWCGPLEAVMNIKYLSTLEILLLGTS